jgi:hypothetical protein
MKHYVYKIEDIITNEFYYGSRSCKCNPNDDKYMGSMQTWKPNKINLIKTILKDDFLTREDAILEESILISNGINDALNRNYHIPNKGFHTVGYGYWTGKVGPHFGFKHTEETKQKQKHMMLGTTHSDETKSKMSKKHIGKIKSIEHRENLRKALLGKKKSKNHIKKLSECHKISVLQYDLNDNLIKEWKGIIDAERQLGITHIIDVCKGRNKTAGGYKWKYKTL